MSFLVVDNIVPPSYQNLILQHMNSQNIEWNYLSNTNNPYDNRTPNIDNLILSSDQSGFVSKHLPNSSPMTYGILMPLVEAAREYIPVETSLLRIKTNMYNKRDSGILHPHVDYFFPHTVVVYYVNDSDGDTILFNEKTDGDMNSIPSRLTVAQRVSPKMGRAVVFNGLMYHCPSPPTKNNSRIAINIDFEHV